MNAQPTETTSAENAARTDMEQLIAALWNEALRCNTQPQPADNFFEVGGDSMAMVTLEFRIQEELGVELSPGTVLASPTLRELSSAIDKLLHGQAGIVPSQPPNSCS